eukprot:6194404-Pleurochrysis_carterae.AAC.1
MMFLPSTDERTPAPYCYRCAARMQLPALTNSIGEEICGDCEVAVSAGGDMAAAHSSWSLDSPVARYGCCFYCWLGKADWFDAHKCKSATQRNLVIDTCLAHLNPFELYKNAPGLPSSTSSPPKCPACDATLSADFIAKEKSDMDAMTVQQLSVLLAKTTCCYINEECKDSSALWHLLGGSV